MVEKPKALHVLGLEITGEEIRGAKLSQKRGKIVLDDLFSIHVPAEEAAQPKPLYIKKTDKSLHAVAKRYLLATVLPPGDVLVRSIEVSLKKTGDIDSILPFQAEPLLPYPVENAVLDRIFLSQTSEGSLLTLLSARKDRVQALLDQWNKYQLEPEVVTGMSAALATFSTLVSPAKIPLFVIHLSQMEAMCVFVRDGRLIASQSCSRNLQSLQQALAADKELITKEDVSAAFKKVDWNHLDVQEYPHLKESVEQLKLELTRTLFSLAKQNKGVDVPDILITGDCSENYDLSLFLGQILKKNVLTPEIPRSFHAPLPVTMKFAVPIGIAMGSLPLCKDSVNFRQHDLIYPDRWKRLKKPLALYFGLCFVFFISLYMLGEAYLGYQEDEVRTEYTNLLSVMQKPHSAFEKELNSKNKEGFFESPSLKNLSMDQLKERVLILEKELASTPDVFPLQPNILTVSDVLAWLNAQPTVSLNDPVTGQATPLIQIDNLSYSMVKRPEITKKNDRYQVKVELEFGAPTPKEAREFHDALIAPNPIIDPKGEVKWSTNRGKYKASFYLKDRTTYLSQ